MAIEDIRAEVGGTVFEVLTRVGARVAPGDTLLVLESMKMEIAVDAPVAGRVAELRVAPGDVVAQGQVLVRVEG